MDAVNQSAKTMDSYVLFLKEHGRKESSLRTYRSAYRTITRILEENGFSTDAREASPGAYYAISNCEEYSDSSRSFYCKAYARWIEWATGRDIAQEACVIRKSPIATTTKWIDDEQFRTLWDAADLEDRVILALGGFMGPYAPNTIGEHIRRLGKRCGIDVTVHSLRRYFASCLNRAGVPPVQIAMLMRHESFSTTYRYYLRPDANVL